MNTTIALNTFRSHATPYNYDSSLGKYRSLEHLGENKLQQETGVGVYSGSVSKFCSSITLRHIQLKREG